MALFHRGWLKVQFRKARQVPVLLCQCLCLCFTVKGRMKNSIAVPILGILAASLVLIAYNCSGTDEIADHQHHYQVKQLELSKQTVESKMAKNEAACSTKTFSVTTMSFRFEKCATSEHANEVDMDSYLDAWDELIRFLNSMGKAFTFVSSDVIDKVGILRNFRNLTTKENYYTIERMLKYEKENNLINYKEAPSKKVPASGSRTLLRLHRALKFLLILIRKLAQNEDDGKVSVMGYNAYHASPMAEYHPWLVRKAVDIAVYMLPDRTTFIKQMCQDLSDDELAKTMQVCSESMDSVYERTHELYRKYDLMEIP